MPDSVKVLAVGSAVGAIRDVFAKIKAIDDKHGKFDFALCVGDFFGPLTDTDKEDEVSLLLDGKLEAPIECYIMQGANPLPDSVIQKFAKTGGELCKNVFLMSKSGLVTTANGLRIACLAGAYEQAVYSGAESAPGFASPFFSSQSIDRLLSNTLTTSSSKQDYKSLSAIQSSSSSSQLVDVFITNVWPASIPNFSNVPLPASNDSADVAPPLDDVCKRLKPRYHFSCSGQPPVFWEREPFVWEDENSRASRFISLGSFGGPAPESGKKQRWFYAFSIASNGAGSTAVANATKNPFSASMPSRKRPFQDQEESGGGNYIFGDVKQPGKRSRIENGPPGKPPPGYKCHRCDSNDHFINDCPERQKPPEGYICRLCNMPGHLVRDCPTKHAVGDTGGRKPKEGYVCRACGSEGHYLDDCPIVNQRNTGGEDGGGRRGKHAPVKEIGPDECWFCLSNPNLAKHLIVSIGEECYVTLPKGQIIPTQDGHAYVPGGGHVLIVPITHYPTLSTIPPDLAPPILDETERYKSALRLFYAKHSCIPVFFEVSRVSSKGARGVHAHVQAIPIPSSEFNVNDIENAFISQGRSQGIDFESENNVEEALASSAGGRNGYFRVDLPDGRKMVHLMKPNVPFSIQFGRQVLVSLLGTPERLDWKACMLSEEEDKADAQSFKTAFAPFVPS
ncbi:CwfJ C-terminus 1-domain-containing protein-like protein [Rhodocollybia butyracea]|uniref:CwfJ C-terminus 1-domain-containing protein-like protein n=1 Tax=Rhodocollybia butyracea TaxID=206335 RepID=A0A9P5QB57_9AGAR|nr:CwfJ C-terminus 1-domain-containing protein-like protein [Rhodocollybia butyracea]